MQARTRELFILTFAFLFLWSFFAVFMPPVAWNNMGYILLGGAGITSLFVLYHYRPRFVGVALIIGMGIASFGGMYGLKWGIETSYMSFIQSFITLGKQSDVKYGERATATARAAQQRVTTIPTGVTLSPNPVLIATPLLPNTITPPSPAATLQPVWQALVTHGGNVRTAPQLTSAVLDQINAYEHVIVRKRTADATWFYITNPRDVNGWVSATLLSIDSTITVHIPVSVP